ncbi:ATP-binding protein [Arthrobacter crystallopoietes]|uniref:sensor histidine kinase n=1 Tax=Crystallibacter crystallopoietes TaxID=37928 RepID=UPI003D23242D
MLDNLLSNAIKYSPAGSAVTIRGWHAGRSILEVSDAGYGMDDADRIRVFDRFFRSSSARRSGIHGTGLGLVVPRKSSNATAAPSTSAAPSVKAPPSP